MKDTCQAWWKRWKITFMQHRIVLFAMAMILPITSLSMTPIFRSPKSPFASGEINKSELKKNTQKVISQSWTNIYWQGHTGWVKSSKLLSPSHFHRLALLSPKAPVRSHPHWNLDPLYLSHKSLHAPIELLIIEEDWALISFRQSSRQGWVPVKYIQPISGDLGFAYTQKTSQLYGQVQNKEVLLEIPPHSRLVIVKITGKQFLVRYKGHLGYIPIQHCLSKIHFANTVKTLKTAHWLPVHQLTTSGLKTPYGLISFSSIKGIRVKKNLYFTARKKTPLYLSPNYSKDHIQLIPTFEPVALIKHLPVKWGFAKINSHHDVGSFAWWKVSSNHGESHLQKQRQKDLHSTDLHSTDLHSTEDIFKRKVYAVASNPLNSKLMFASARGVFRSTDGKTWRKLSKFGTHNHPIAIAKNGYVFIGSHKSRDNGKTFTPFLRWDKIAWAIHHNKKFSPNNLSLQEIKILDQRARKISIIVKTQNQASSQKHTLISINSGKTWAVSNSK